jgi:hypothetical protein
MLEKRKMKGELRSKCLIHTNISNYNTNKLNILSNATKRGFDLFETL